MSKLYSKEEDRIILDATSTFNPQDYKEKSKELSEILKIASTQIAEQHTIHRKPQSVRDRYYRLIGINTAKVTKQTPGPKISYDEPLPRPEPIPVNAPTIRYIDDKMIQVEYPKEQSKIYVIGEPSFIRPPTKAQLMSRTGFLVRRDHER